MICCMSTKIHRTPNIDRVSLTLRLGPNHCYRQFPGARSIRTSMQIYEAMEAGVKIGEDQRHALMKAVGESVPCVMCGLQI